jgi:prephenate dehydrogenase
VTPTKQTNSQALEQVKTLWQEAGSTVLTMDPHLHDKILGAVSHLPHVVAFALMAALIDIRTEVPSLDQAGHSGGGLRDTTRIAASSPEMWRDIFLWNRDNVVAFIEAYERSLGELKQLIRTGDAAGIEKTLERAKQEREKFPVRTG